jgi:hypothetical protein
MKTTLNIKSKQIPALACALLALLCLSSLAAAGKTNPIAPDGNRPAGAQSDLINAPVRQAGSVGASASPDGRYFMNLTENSNHTEAGMVFVDSWGTEDLAGIGTEFLLELYIDKYDTDKNLTLMGYYWDGESGIESVENFTDPLHIVSGCLNASIWADKFGTDDWKIIVAGTYQPGGAIAGFCAIITYDGTIFTIVDLYGENQWNGQETYFTDMVIFDFENDTHNEIVICGYRNDTTKWNGLLWIYNTTGAALTIEHTLEWEHTTRSVIPTALMYGDLCNDSLWELAVVGFEDDGAGETRAREDAFFGSETPWTGPDYFLSFPFGEAVNSSFQDVAIGDYDGSGSNQSLAVGLSGTQGIMLGVNWTDSLLDPDVIGLLSYDGADYTRFYEVEIADASPDPPQTGAWASHEVVIAGLIGNESLGEKLLIQVYDLMDGGFLWNHTSTDYFIQVFPWMELMLTDWTNDGEPEVTFGWTLENSIVALETVFDVGLYTPPGAPETEAEPESEEETGRKPHPVKKGGITVWEGKSYNAYPYVFDPAAFLELHGMHLVYLLVISGILVAAVLVGWKLLGPYMLLAGLAFLGVMFLLASFTALMNPLISYVENVWNLGWSSLNTWWSLVADYWTTRWDNGLAFWNSYDWTYVSADAYGIIAWTNWFNVWFNGYYNWCEFWAGLWVYWGAYVDVMIV